MNERLVQGVDINKMSRKGLGEKAGNIQLASKLAMKSIADKILSIVNPTIRRSNSKQMMAPRPTLDQIHITREDSDGSCFLPHLFPIPCREICTKAPMFTSISASHGLFPYGIQAARSKYGCSIKSS